MGTSYIKPTGGDYATLEDWEAAKQGILTEPEIAIIDGDWSSTVDTDPVVIDGWTTSAANYIYIYTTSQARHKGVWSSSYYILGGSVVRNIDIAEEYVRISGIQITSTSGSESAAIRIQTAISSGDIRLSNIIVKEHATGVFGSHTGGTVYLWNSIIYDGTGAAIRNDYLGTLNAYNVSTIDCNYGFRNTGSGTLNCINCLGHSNTTADFNELSGTLTCNYCASADLTADDQGGTGNREECTFSFVDEDANNFHLKSDDTEAMDNGNGATPKALFQDDIDGDARPAEDLDWDIGADEYVSGVSADEVDVYESVVISEYSSSLVNPLRTSVYSSLSLADYVNTLLSRLNISSSDSLSLSEQISTLINRLNILSSDDIGLSEQVDALIKQLNIPTFDTVTLDDWSLSSVTSYGISLYVSKADAGFPTGDEWHTHVDLTHDIGIYAVYYISGSVYYVDVFDSIAANDYENAYLNPLRVSVFDISALTEISTSLIKNLVASVYDQVLASEFISAVLKQLRLSTYDEVLVYDVATLLRKQHSIGVFDLVTIDDTASALLKQLNLSIFEALSVTDYVELYRTALPYYSVDVSEAISVADSITALIGAFLVNVQEALAISESSTQRLNRYNIFTYEAILLAEHLALSFSYMNISTAEAIAIAENVAASVILSGSPTISVSDSILIYEQVNFWFKKLYCQVYDSISSSEYVKLTKILHSSCYDIVTIDDEPSIGAVESGELLWKNMKTISVTPKLAVEFIVPEKVTYSLTPVMRIVPL